MKWSSKVGVLQKILLKNTAPELPIVTPKLVYMVKILDCKNRDPRTNYWAPRGV